MATLKEAIEIAKKEPNSERSQKLLEGLKAGAFDEIAAQEGIDMTKFKAQFETPEKAEQVNMDESMSVEERQTGLKARLGSAFQAAKETIGGAAEQSRQVQERTAIAKGKLEPWEKRIDDLKEAFNTGQISEQEFQEKSAQAEEKIKEFKKEGAGILPQITGVLAPATEAAKGLTLSPAAGFFKPEVEKVGEKLSAAGEVIKETAVAGFEKLPEGAQDYLRGAAEKLSPLKEKLGEIAQENPALGEGLQTIFNLAEITPAAAISKAAVPKLASGLKKSAQTAAQIPAGTKSLVAGIGERRAAKVATKDVNKIAQTIAPQITKKNVQEAAKKGLAVPAKKRFFRGDTPTKIELDDELIKASKTVADRVPNAAKLSAEELPFAIKGAISEIATPLREAFKNIKVPVSTKKKIDEVWESVKKAQDKNPRLGTVNVKSFQKEFEKDYLGKIKQVWESPDGFRNTTLDDMWEVVKSYDNDWGDAVKNLAVKAEGVTEAQRKIWLQNRAILRDAMDSLAETIDDPKMKRAFEEMSDLYKAQTAALNAIKPVKGKSGVIKKLAKETAKLAVPGAVAGAIISR